MTSLTFKFNNTTLVELSESNTSYTFKSTDLGSHNTTSAALSFNSSDKPDYLTPSYNITVIDSIKSGNRIETKKVYRQLLQPLLKQLSIKHTYFETSSAQSISNYASTLTATTKQLVIFISGDTSINEFYNSLPLKHPDITILPVPQGTGNALSHSLNLSSPISSIKALIFSKLKFRFQLYEAKFSKDQAHITKNGERLSDPIESLKFAVVGSWCLHSTLVAESDTPELRKFGNDRFKLAAQELLTNNPAFKGSIVIKSNNLDQGKENEELSPQVILNNGQLSYFVLAAVPRFESTFEISPLSKAESPSLYLLYFKHMPSESTMEIMTQAYNKGSHVKNPKVKYLEITKDKEVELRLDNSMETRLSKVCVDGTIVELVGKNRTVSFGWVDSGNLFCLC